MSRISNKHLNLHIFGGGIIKRKAYLISLIALTFITTSAIMYFHPDRDDIFPKVKNKQLLGFVVGIKNEDSNTDQDIHMIDDQTLNRFIEFYSDKNIENLEIYQKEEIRCILESMGNYNTSKLKKFLKNDPDRKEGEIYKLLSENLFDKQLMLLDEMLN